MKRWLTRAPMRALALLTAVTMAAGVAQFGEASTASVAFADASTGSGGQFVPVQGRILDTRAASSVGGYTTQMPANTWRSVQVTGQVGIPTTGVAAVAVNFTALNDAAAGHLNADKDEATPNTTGTYLFWNGDGASTNSGVVAVGSDGKIQVKATTATDLVIDVQGYYTAGNPVAGGFVPLPESRLIDTRNGTGLAEAPLAENSTTTIQVAGLAGVPSDASAVMLNFLVLNQTNSGSVVPYPADQPKPMQKLAFDPSDSDSTTSAVGLSSGSPSGAIKVNIEMNGSGGTLDLVVDVLGYFTATSSSGAFTPAAARVYDSRNTGNSPLAAGATRTIPVAGVAGVPTSGIGAVAANVEIFDPNGANGGFTHVWPDDQAEPNPSMAVHYDAGGAASNLMTLALGADGGIEIHNMGSDAVDFAIDIQGWYSPAPLTVVSTSMCAQPNEDSCQAPDDFTSSPTPVLSATATSAAGTPINYSFELWSSDGQSPTGTSPLSSGTVSAVASGHEADFSSPTLSDGDMYEYRVQAQSGTGVGDWSPWFIFSVDNPGSLQTTTTTDDFGNTIITVSGGTAAQKQAAYMSDVDSADDPVGASNDMDTSSFTQPQYTDETGVEPSYTVSNKELYDSPRANMRRSYSTVKGHTDADVTSGWEEYADFKNSRATAYWWGTQPENATRINASMRWWVDGIDISVNVPPGVGFSRSGSEIDWKPGPTTKPSSVETLVHDPAVHFYTPFTFYSEHYRNDGDFLFGTTWYNVSD
jgi:hypothetical protein